MQNDSLISTICVVIEFKHDYYKWCLLYLIQSNEMYLFIYFLSLCCFHKIGNEGKVNKREKGRHEMSK